MTSSLTAKIRGSLKRLNSLQDLLHEELQDVLDAEHQIIDALPQMIDAASSRRLKDAFRVHLEQAKGQSERLKDIFKLFDWKPERRTCNGMKGLLKESEALFFVHGDASVKDAALISAAQRVAHYAIAAHGALRTFASMLGNDEARDLLQTTLDQEGETDHLLTEIALSSVNERAAAA